jgi:hypothetical protein
MLRPNEDVSAITASIAAISSFSERHHRPRFIIAVRVLFFTVFRLKHDAQEIWQSGRLVSVTSTTDRDGTRLQVSGNAAAGGFRIVGENGPFLAAADLLTTDALWDRRIAPEQRLIDV